MVGVEERCCMQLGEYCSWISVDWLQQLGLLLPAVSWTGSGSGGEPACCI